MSTQSGPFLPPSIDKEATVTGESYAYYSPVPAVLLAPVGANEDVKADDTQVTNEADKDTTKDDSKDTTEADKEAGNDNDNNNNNNNTNDTFIGPPCALGVDEAGRGPVLGPMVYGVFYLPTTLSDPLLRKTHHFDDSKVLTPAVREALMQAVCEPESDLAQSCGYAIKSLSARDIGAGMLQPAPATYNLNAQAMDATVELIRGVIARGVNVAEIYVDTVGPPATYQEKLQRLFPTARVTVAKKADSLYPCVSAASVCAKVTRDKALEVLYRARMGLPDDDDLADGMAWGSGYPSDAKCVAWLRDSMHPIFGWGPECRFSWGTARDMLEGKSIPKVEWPDEEVDDEASKLAAYFSAMAANKSAGAMVAREMEELGGWFGKPTTEFF